MISECVQAVMEDLLRGVAELPVRPEEPDDPFTSEDSELDEDCVISYVLRRIVDEISAESTTDSATDSATPDRRARLSISSRRKTKFPTTLISDSEKRRSSRVKATVIKPASEPMPSKADYSTEIRELLPEAMLDLLANTLEGESDAHTPGERAGEDLLYSQPFPDEREQTKRLVADSDKNRGVVHLMGKWIRRLSSAKLTERWPRKLRQIYSEIYEIWRLAIELPDPFSDCDPDFLLTSARAAVLWIEFRLDAAPDSCWRGTETPDKALEEDVNLWLMLVSRHDIRMEDSGLAARFYWAIAKYYLNTSRADRALLLYRSLLEFITKRYPRDWKLELPNSAEVITVSKIEESVEQLKSTQAMQELQTCYDRGEYDTVMLILEPISKLRIPARTGEGRLNQVTILLRTIRQTARQTERLELLEETLRETLYRRGMSRSGGWEAAMDLAMQAIHEGMENGGVTKLGEQARARLCGNALRLAEESLATVDSDKSAYPWLILYTLIRNSEALETPSEDITLPASLR